MGIRLVETLAETDLRLRSRYVDGFVPEEVFDIHAHLFHTKNFAPGKVPAFLDQNRGYGLDEFNQAMARLMPHAKVEGLFFGYPSAGNDRAGENEWLRSQIEPGLAHSNSRALVLAAPGDDRGAIQQMLVSKTFIGIKPYRLYANVADTNEAPVESFASEWMWELCHQHDGVLMLHIMRAGGITDPANQEALRRLCTSYPRCRLVLAHVARSFNYRHAREGLSSLVDLDNVWVDTSAVTQAGAFRAALEILGPRRVLWGSDYMVSELRGSCISQGDGFTWIYSDDEAAKKLTVFGSYTTVGLESLICLKEACEDTGMTKADVGDIFRNNALRLLAPHLPSGAIPRTETGPELWGVAKTKIACGTGLLSKRAHLFDPATWPSYYSRCKGAHVWDLEGKRYVDFTGGVGAILLGHSDDAVNAAIRRRVSAGSYCTLASPDEVALADLLLSLHPWAGKVRYARGGGEALALAVRIARAATGRSGVLFCGYHGWNDWYLAANLGESTALDGHLLPGLEPRGVPSELRGTAIPFRYNDWQSFEEGLQRMNGKLAAVVMEPMRSEQPRDEFLQKVSATCRETGGVFVLDEVTSGWRYGFPGAAPALGIEPDIAVYAKAMSNGIPCAAVVGRDEVMEPANQSFISSSYWTDGIGPAAAIACIERMRDLGVQPHVWRLGLQLQEGLRTLATRHSSLGLKIIGMPCAPAIAFAPGSNGAAAKILCIRRMLQRGYLFSSQLYVMWPHSESTISELLGTLDDVLRELADLHSLGRLEAEAGPLPASAGFARLV